MKKKAVILMNLGGPKDLLGVKPFLFNLFNDKAIIRLPQPFRFLIAKLISSRREEEAKEIYAAIGGGSPLLEETQKQAIALEDALGKTYRVFVMMRYTTPFAEEVAKAIKEEDFGEIILLPLYPQYSTTTTASSLSEMKKALEKEGLSASRAICCYPGLPGFVDYYAKALQEKMIKIKDKKNLRILFSAHGLPLSIVKKGDPYPKQIEKTAQGILEKVEETVDHVVCYQSKVGPLPWLEPSTESEIKRAGKEGKSLLLIPIAFVSEHSETLYELDIMYRKLAKEGGVPLYERIKTPGAEEIFIKGLAAVVLEKETEDLYKCKKHCQNGSCFQEKETCVIS